MLDLGFLAVGPVVDKSRVQYAVTRSSLDLLLLSQTMMEP